MRRELSVEWAVASGGNGDICPKNFDFGARVNVSGRVDATAAGKLPHVHND